MASTYRQLLSRVDLLLGEPHPANPSLPTRWEVLQGVTQLIFNVALNSPVSWTVQHTEITVADSIDTYTIAAADFGKDLLVETYDPSDLLHTPRPVSRTSLQSQIYTTFPASGTVTVDGVTHSAQSFAFYRENNATKFRVFPTPTTTAWYRVWYETASPNTDSDQNSLFAPAGETYLVSLCALNLLPYCQWAGMDKNETMEKRRNLEKILAANVAIHEKQWKIYLASDRQSGLVRLRGFGDSWENEDWSY